MMRIEDAVAASAVLLGYDELELEGQQQLQGAGQ